MTQTTVTLDENEIAAMATEGKKENPYSKRVMLINVLPKNIELGMRFVPETRGLMHLDLLRGRKTEEITSFKWSRRNCEVIINGKYVYTRNGEMYVV